MNDDRIDPRFRTAVREELERLPERRAAEPRVGRPWFAAAVAVVVAALVIGVSVLALRAAPHLVPASPSPSPSPSSTAETTAFGPVVATLPAGPANEQFVAASSDQAFYAATTSQDFRTDEFWTITRTDLSTGARVRTRLDLRWLNALVVGPDGLYVTTSVIERDAAGTPDTIVRLDLRTLATLATIHPGLKPGQDSGLHLVASADALCVSSEGGSVARLDPHSLAIRARSADLLTSKRLQDGDFLASGPVLAGGRVWVEDSEKLMALDPATLRSERSVPFSGAGAYRGQLVELGGELTLIGTRIVRVPAEGSPTQIGALADPSIPVPVAGSIAVPMDPGDSVVLVGADGRVRATEHAGLSIVAASRSLLWVEGLPSHPNELAAIRVDMH